MSNDINSSKLYNTGFIPNTSQLRIKQGLSPQVVSNACILPNQLNQNIFNTKFYPLKNIDVDYKLPEIPDNCICLHNISGL